MIEIPASWLNMEFSKPVQSHILNFEDESIREEKIEEELINGYINDLSNISEGRSDSNKYEKVTNKIIEHIFKGELKFLKDSSRTYDGNQIRDYLYVNQQRHDFWKDMFKKYRAEFVVFDAKNGKKVKIKDVNQMGSYLGKKMGRFGIIIGRKKPEKGAIDRAHRIFNDDDKVILFITDDLLKKLYNIHKKNKNPTEEIEKLFYYLKSES